MGSKGAGMPALLGAGSGLEVPWALAPPGSVGWDADPWSRVRTCIRHRVWPPWVFGDLTGGWPSSCAPRRCRTARQPWTGRARGGRSATLRLAGLVGSLAPDAAPLSGWIRVHRPGTILCANVMGQFGVLASAAVERAFGGRSPWTGEEGVEDPLEEALRGWTARAVGAFLAALARSGRSSGSSTTGGWCSAGCRSTLGALREPWTAQLVAPGALEADDPLCGIDVLEAFPGRKVERHDRWIWTSDPGRPTSWKPCASWLPYNAGSAPLPWKPMADFRRLFLGRRLASDETHATKISNPIALAVFSSDALSSVAYATQEIMASLSTSLGHGVAAAAAAGPPRRRIFGLSVPVAIGITLLLLDPGLQLPADHPRIPGRRRRLHRRQGEPGRGRGPDGGGLPAHRLRAHGGRVGVLGHRGHHGGHARAPGLQRRAHAPGHRLHRAGQPAGRQGERRPVLHPHLRVPAWPCSC